MYLVNVSNRWRKCWTISVFHLFISLLHLNELIFFGSHTISHKNHSKHTQKIITCHGHIVKATRYFSNKFLKATHTYTGLFKVEAKHGRKQKPTTKPLQRENVLLSTEVSLSCRVNFGKELYRFASWNITNDQIDNNKITHEWLQQQNDVWIPKYSKQAQQRAMILKEKKNPRKISTSSLGPLNGRSFHLCVRVCLCCILSCNESILIYDWTVDDPNTKIIEMTMSLPKCSILRCCMLLWQVRWIYYILSKRHTLTYKHGKAEWERNTLAFKVHYIKRIRMTMKPFDNKTFIYAYIRKINGDNHDRNEP